MKQLPLFSAEALFPVLSARGGLMPKSTDEKTKSDYIREALAKWPDLTTGEIAKKLENGPTSGMGITMPYVSSIKSMDAKKAKKKRKKQASPHKARSRRVVSMTALRRVRELAKEVGGVNQLRLLLDLLEELK